MFTDFSERALTCSDEIATFNTLYTNSSEIFQHAAAMQARDPSRVRRLAVGDMFMEEEVVVTEEEAAAAAAAAAAMEEEEEEELVENTRDDEIDELVEEFPGRLMHRDVGVEQLPGGTPAKRVIKVMVYIGEPGRGGANGGDRSFCRRLPNCCLRSRLRHRLITRGRSWSRRSRARDTRKGRCKGYTRRYSGR